ncbi:MAG: DUF4394 domain-containing protein [Chitinophagaceae bacterium]|nr:DUF4394 domain-containing protein [Chitinophagaceae bacterium]
MPANKTHNMYRTLLSITAGAMLSVLLTACEKKDMGSQPKGPDVEVVALTNANTLVTFNASMPSKIDATVMVTQLAEGEKLLSIDFRPATGELYGLGSSSRIYVINRDNGKARAIGSTSFTPAISSNMTAIDFNPTVDRIRLVGSTGQNLRLHPETGVVVATDGIINGASASIGAIGYTNAMAGAASTVLYDIDVKNGMLYKQDPPNNGTLVAVGSLGFSSSMMSGFDIAAGTNTAIATVADGMSSNLYTVDLMTGKASSIGKLSAAVVDIAIPTMPVAYAVTASNQLHIFNPNQPASTVAKDITGLQAMEKMLGIDFRPANGQLYGLGSSGRLYAFNLATGAATQVGSSFGTALLGSDFGFDFNPTVDRIRVVSNLGQNLRINPNDGAVVAVDGLLNPGSPAVSAAAYTNNFAGTSSTELYVIDHVSGKLYLQNPPNNGTLELKVSLSVGFSAANGFDIGSRSNEAWAIYSSASGNMLVKINLKDGSTSSPKAFAHAATGFAIGTGF